MAKVSIYLNFTGQTEEAFNFYKQIFGTEFSSPFMYMKDVPGAEIPAEEKMAVMHVALPILGGTEIMGTDMLKSMGHELRAGNNVTINLEPDSREEVDRLYALLSGDSDNQQCNPPTEQFWGAYWGSCLDKHNVRWMFNFDMSKENNAK